MAPDTGSPRLLAAIPLLWSLSCRGLHRPTAPNGTAGARLRACPARRELEALSPVRDMGHEFGLESFTVPQGDSVDLDGMEEAKRLRAEISWKLQETVTVPGRRTPPDPGPWTGEGPA